MRKIIVTEFISLDGVVEAPGGEEGYKHTGWTFDIEPDPLMYAFKAEELSEVEGLLLGRRTYEGFAAAWPERDGDFADKFNSMPKYVVSSTLTDPAWENTTVLSGDPAEAVRELKQTAPGPILLNGSAQLAHALAEADLVDEYRAMVHPVLIADGLRMFPDPEAMKKLKLKDTIAYESGVALLIYEPAES
jgi:dihydrofolate reductase